MTKIRKMAMAMKELWEELLKVSLFVLGKITLCLIIVGLYSFLCFELFKILDELSKGWPTFLIVISVILFMAIIAGCIVCCIASIYFLFNGYAIYIIGKTLGLYNKPDGEYVILPENKWLFWLPLLCIKTANITGLKAKKNGNFIELRGTKNRHIPYTFFHSIFGKDYPSSKDCPPIEFNQFSEFGDTRYGQGNRILFTHDDGVCLFKLIRYEEDYHPEEYQAYENASEHSHNHLMGIVFGGINYYGWEKIIYNIITQIDENKIIRKEEDEYSIIEYYYEEEKYEWNGTSHSLIAKVTNIKEGSYFYKTNMVYSIKKFMQRSGIYPKFEYFEDSGYYVMVYYSNGNYFMLRQNPSLEVVKLSIEPITLEKYSKILEDDCKYQKREKKYREEKEPIQKSTVEYNNILPKKIIALLVTIVFIAFGLFLYRVDNYILNEYERAIANYTKVLKIKPDDYEILKLRGDAYKKNGDFDRAIVDYSEALRIKPDDYEILGLRGDAYAHNGDFDRAIADYSEAIKIKPDDYDVLNIRGWTYYKMGYYGMAIEDCNAALMIETDHQSTLIIRGKAYSKMGYYDQATEDFVSVLKINPYNVYAIDGLRENRDRINQNQMGGIEELLIELERKRSSNEK